MMTHKIVETKLEKSRNNSRDINGYYRCHLLLCKVIPEIFVKFVDTVNFTSGEKPGLSNKYIVF